MFDRSPKFTMLNQFTPENSALVLIDYQVGTVQLIKTMSSDLSVRNAVMLAKAAKALDLPVVLTTSQETNIQGPLPSIFENLLPEAYKKPDQTRRHRQCLGRPQVCGSRPGDGAQKT